MSEDGDTHQSVSRCVSSCHVISSAMPIRYATLYATVHQGCMCVVYTDGTNMQSGSLAGFRYHHMQDRTLAAEE